MQIWRDQLWPDQPVVIRTKILAGDLPIRGKLNGNAPFQRDGAMTADPLVDGGRRHADPVGKDCLRANKFAGERYLVHTKTLASLNSKVNSQAIYSIA